MKYGPEIKGRDQGSGTGAKSEAVESESGMAFVVPYDHQADEIGLNFVKEMVGKTL